MSWGTLAQYEAVSALQRQLKHPLLTCLRTSAELFRCRRSSALTALMVSSICLCVRAFSESAISTSRCGQRGTEQERQLMLNDTRTYVCMYIQCRNGFPADVGRGACTGPTSCMCTRTGTQAHAHAQAHRHTHTHTRTHTHTHTQHTHTQTHTNTHTHTHTNTHTHTHTHTYRDILPSRDLQLCEVALVHLAPCSLLLALSKVSHPVSEGHKPLVFTPLVLAILQMDLPMLSCGLIPD